MLWRNVASYTLHVLHAGPLHRQGIRCSEASTPRCLFKQVRICFYLAIKYLHKINQTYLNKIDFKLLLKWNHCITNCPEKERQISFYYFTCSCICEAVFYLKTKWHSKYTCSHYISVAVLITNKIRIGDKSFPISPFAEAFLSCHGKCYFSITPADRVIWASLYPITEVPNQLVWAE